MLYEGTLLFAVAFVATWLFQFAAGGVIVDGWQRTALQLYLGAVFAAYFLWCWLRGGQTLAMKAWHIRIVDVTPGRALLRLALAAALLPVSIAWALFDRDRQFLHDRLAGTRLVNAAPPTTS